MNQIWIDDLTDEQFSELQHYGTPRHSGRYPWGSGENPFQHEKFYMSVQQLKREGMTDNEIAQEFNMSTTDYRALKSISTREHKMAEAIKARELAAMVDDEGNRLYSNVEIGKMLGRPDTTIGNYLKEDYTVRTMKMQDVIDNLKSQVGDNNYIDIGPGSEFLVGCSAQMLKNAARIMSGTDDLGYELYDVNVRQIGTGLMTKVKVLAPPGTPFSEVVENKDLIKLPNGGVELYPPDANGITLNKYALQEPTSIDSKRVMVNYAETGGLEKDGVIELRRGVDDIALGNANYMQVRISVDGTHYLKGMAVYADDLPEGIDVRFNTNKHEGTPMLGDKNNTVLKPIKDDPDNPFGATIRQMNYIDSKTGEEKLSAINVVNEEGDWGGENGWSRTISSQMLGKQNEKLIQRQLGLSYADKVAEFDDIMSVTNPVVKKKLLESFADDCDTSAVHLKAAPFPRQTWNVILPVESMSPDEIYAPQYKNGETVVLIRYPHGGTFEIPQLKVNNTNAEGKRVLGNAIDAVGINAKVAEKLSGADFDGDTVLVIPANSSSSNVRIKTSPTLEGLKDFDPKERYKGYEGMKVMSENMKQREMGVVSNLITDMTLKGATPDELAAAVRHSMVVIDAVKHKLDYQQSYEDNNIEALKQKYQRHDDGSYGGASTLLSRAKSKTYIPERKEGQLIEDPKTGKKKRQYIDSETGEKLYTETGATKREALKDKNGEYVLNEKGRKIYVDTGKKVMEESTQMKDTKDARTLSSGLVVEELYADYANKMKGLANEARKAYLATPSLKYDPKAKEEYKQEVESLNAKVLTSLKNAPRERQAQILANINYQETLASNPGMDKAQKKKVKSQCLNGARATVNAKKALLGKDLPITEREWKAVNSGAISNNRCQQIVDNADLNVLKQLSMPRSNSNSLSSAKVAKIHSMTNSGFSISEIAANLGVSTSTVSKYVKEG